jgi:hypothetical protein
MNPQTRIELTRELERMRVTPVGASSEVIFGAVLITLSIRFTVFAVSQDRLIWVGFLFLLMGIVALVHPGYLMLRRSLNRKLQSLYQAILES